ncbi:hypothetical protein ACVWW1_006804 [Bradyrhizobium sp. JR3.5]
MAPTTDPALVARMVIASIVPSETVRPSSISST